MRQGIHSSVAFCYQKIRKENGAVYTIVLGDYAVKLTSIQK